MPRRTILFRFPKVERSRVSAIALAVLLAYANAGSRARAQSTELIVTPGFEGKPAITPLEQIELNLNRPLQPAEGRLAIFVGLTDMTVLFTPTPNGLRAAPRSLPWPAGENQMTLYLVSPNNIWRELARFTLTVSNSQPAAAADDASQPNQSTSQEQTAGTTPQNGHAGTAGGPGRPTLALIPSLTISLESQPAEAHFPGSNRPDRRTFTDFTLQGTLRTDLARGPFTSQSQFDFVGTSFQKAALRSGELGERAPQLDLSSYLMQFQVGKAKVALGHVSFGNNRFLMDNFSSRGITVAIPVNKRLDFSLTAMNGTSIVGWDNFFGLDRRKHQIVSGTVGYEFLPERPGGSRFEVSLLHGSLLPINNVNQGNVTDAEHSKGYGLRLLASNRSQRFRADAGFARTSFNNPDDPSLNQGLALTSVRQNTRKAHYLEAGFDILKDLPLTETTKANLILTYRHQRVDPLFRSVVANVQANKFQNQLDLLGTIGEISIALSDIRFNDNLDNIPSILKAFTRHNGLILGAPLGSLFGSAAAPKRWLPTLSYNFDRTHQLAKSVPTNADFRPPQMPDQLSTNKSFAAEWQAERWRFTYRLNDSFQDQRSDREGVPALSTLGNLAHTVTLGLTPATSFDLGVDLSRENLNSKDSNANKDKDRNDTALRFGINLTWRMMRNSTLATSFSNTLARSAGDLSLTSRRSDTGFNLQWSYGFGWEKSHLQKVQGQFYIRYATQHARSLEQLLGINSFAKSQTLNVGLNFTFF